MATLPARQAPIRRRRSPIRYRPRFEGLEPRLALAAGLAGTFQPIPDQVVGRPIASVDPSLPTRPPAAGGPVSLVLLSSSAGPLTDVRLFATVDWGDGTPTEAATTFAGEPNGEVLLQGSDHTYATTGTFTVTVAVLQPGDAAATVFQEPVNVNPADLPLTGQFADGTQSGSSLTEGIATNPAPTFNGTTQPGATVAVSVAPVGSPTTPTVVATGTADAAGRWSLTSRNLAPGTYVVSAQAVSLSGETAAAKVQTNPLDLDPFSKIPVSNVLVVPAPLAGTAPKVSGFRIVDARAGAFQITFADSDPSGLILAPLLAASNYTATVSTGPHSSRPLAVSGLTNGNVGSAPVPTPFTYPSVAITGRLGDGSTRLPRRATITLTVHAAGITSAAGIALDGSYLGHYPTGRGTLDVDFRVRIATRNGRVVSAVPVRAPGANARPVHAPKHHA